MQQWVETSHIVGAASKKPEECSGWSQSDEKISMWGVGKAYEWHEQEDWCRCTNN
jgi:hypothetical protein